MVGASRLRWIGAGGFCLRSRDIGFSFSNLSVGPNEKSFVSGLWLFGFVVFFVLFH